MENKKIILGNESASARSFFMLPEVKRRIAERVECEGKPLHVLLQERIALELDNVDHMDNEARIEHFVGINTAIRELRRDYRRRLWDMKYSAAKTDVDLPREIETELAALAEQSGSQARDLAELMLLEIAVEQ